MRYLETLSQSDVEEETDAEDQILLGSHFIHRNIKPIISFTCYGAFIFAVPKIPKNMKYEIPNPKPTLDYYEPTYVGGIT